MEINVAERPSLCKNAKSIKCDHKILCFACTLSGYLVVSSSRKCVFTRPRPSAADGEEAGLAELSRISIGPTQP
jgi:hypothetical protein